METIGEAGCETRLKSKFKSKNATVKRNGPFAFLLLNFDFP
jgi:hypothetical protein